MLSWLCFLIILSLSVLFSFGNVNNNSTTIKLSNGYIQGLRHKTSSGREANIFLGIPYAEPPIEALRFQKTVSKTPWNGTLQCHVYKPACPQTRKKPYQDENCLYLNVFSSLNCTPENLCPILYWVHGGASEFLSPTMFPVDTMINNFAWNDVVVVTVAYRLGALGFWSTGTEEAQGNWAIYDIIEGLKWIHMEGSKFGGNISHVTVWGYSSSSVLISLLTLTDVTRDLFHQSMPMSSGGHNDFIINNNLSIYNMLAQKLGCANQSENDHVIDIIGCMRTIPVKSILKTYDKIRNYDPVDPNVSPMVSWPRNDGLNGLFPKPISQMIAERRPIPTLTGNTRNEVGTFKPRLENATEITVADLCTFLINGSAYTRKSEIIDACIKRYVSNPDYGGVAQGNKFSFWTEQAAELDEDYNFFALTFREAWTLTQAGAPVYLYSFDYEKKGMEGVSMSHGQDMDYLTDPLYPAVADWDDRDLQIKQQYISLLTNFIKYGNPTPWRESFGSIQWPKFTASISRNKYFSINLPSSVQTAFHRSAVKFWDFQVPRIENNYSSPCVHKKLLLVDEEPFDRSILGRNQNSVNWKTMIFYYLLLVCICCLVITVIAGIAIPRGRHALYYRII